MSELKPCQTGIGRARSLKIEKLERAKTTMKYLCKDASSVLYAEDLYLIESLIDAEIIKTEQTRQPRFSEEEMEALTDLTAACNCLTSRDCPTCKYYDRLCSSTWIEEKTKDAIATVRSMLKGGAE